MSLTFFRVLATWPAHNHFEIKLCALGQQISFLMVEKMNSFLMAFIERDQGPYKGLGMNIFLK